MAEDKSSKQDRNKRLIEQTKATRFQPGVSGNPGGRPKNSLSALLREFLDANDLEEKRAIVKELIAVAKKTGQRGQMPAMKEVWDREDGKVPDTHRFESDVPVNIILELVERKEDA